MPFLTPGAMTTHGKRDWKMTEELDYQYGSKFIRVPIGFVHDLASIPRPFNLFIRQAGLHRNAAILHDYLYSKQGLINNFKRLTRKECDDIFHQAMIESGVNTSKACMMHKAVRLGGRSAWKECK